MPNTNWPQEMAKYFFAQSDEISPNLVTLFPSR